jgi:hypothetical protein
MLNSLFCFIGKLLEDIYFLRATGFILFDTFSLDVWFSTQQRKVVFQWRLFVNSKCYDGARSVQLQTSFLARRLLVQGAE